MGHGKPLHGGLLGFYLYSSLLDIRSLGLGQRGGQSGLGALPFGPMGKLGLPKPGWQTHSHESTRPARLELRVAGADRVRLFWVGVWGRFLGPFPRTLKGLAVARGGEQDHETSGVNGAPLRRGLVVMGCGESVCFFERGQLEVNDGGRKAGGKRGLSGLGVEGPSLSPACCWLSSPGFVTPTSTVTLSLAFLGPVTHHTSGFLSFPLALPHL